MSFASVVDSIQNSVGSFFGAIVDLIEKTNLPQQVSQVDIAGLSTNPWFLIPFIGLLGYMIYKQAFRDMAILGLLLGVWYVSGTDYMKTLVVGDELQVKKVLPVLFGGAAILGVIIYLLLGRSK